MTEIYYPTDEQLFGLYRFLVFLQKSKMHWFSIEERGATILIKVDPPKGEIDIMLFYVYEDGRVEPDESADRLY